MVKQTFKLHRYAYIDLFYIFKILQENLNESSATAYNRQIESVF